MDSAFGASESLAGDSEEGKGTTSYEWEPNDIFGYHIKIDLKQLIEGIIIPPNAKSFYMDQVKVIVEKFGLNPKLVCQSEIDIDPVY